MNRKSGSNLVFTQYVSYFDKVLLSKSIEIMHTKSVIHHIFLVLFSVATYIYVYDNENNTNYNERVIIMFEEFVPLDNNQVIIYKNGEFGYSAFYAGSLDCLVPMDKNIFKWHIDAIASELIGEPVLALTLGEIAERFVEMEYKGMVTIFVNRLTSGEIYQLGNYGTYEWFELGTLRGFA